MSKDPIVEEVRRVREELFAEFGYDLSALAKFLGQEEGKDKGEMVQAPVTRRRASLRQGTGQGAR